MMKIAFGGQVAEEIFFGEVSTGPASDLAYATTVGAQMIGSCGMGQTLISLQAVSSSSFSDTNLVGRVLADTTLRTELRDLLSDLKSTTTELMRENQHIVVALRDALLDRHELVGHEILDVIEQASKPPVRVPAQQQLGD